MAGLDLPEVRLGHAGQHAQQRGLARAVEAQDHHARAAVDGQVDVVEDLERAVGLGQPGGPQRGLAAGCRCREADRGDLVLDALALHGGHQPLGALEHLLRRHGLGRLGAHLLALGLQCRGLLLRVGVLPLAAVLVLLALGLVALPVHVVDIHDRPVGVEVEDLVDHHLHELDVVGDHQDAAGVAAQELAQPGHRIGVEVVGGLVEQHRVGVREQDAGQLHASALTARERAQRLVEHAVRKVQVRGDRGGLGLGRVAAAGLELGLQAGVALHGPVPHGLVLGGHLLLGRAHAGDDLSKAARREDPVAGQLLHVLDLGILREVADRAAAGHGASGRDALAGQHAGHGRLAGAVAPDQADLVALLHPEVHVVHQQPGSGSQFEVRHGDHFRHGLSTGAAAVGGRRNRCSLAGSLPRRCQLGHRCPDRPDRRRAPAPGRGASPQA